MTKRVLLTGGAGAIGIHVAAHFLKHTDWDIHIVDSFAHGGDPNRIMELGRGHEEYRDRVTVTLCDLAQDPLRLDEAADHILHLAALSDVLYSVQHPYEVIQNNVQSTLRLLEWAAKHEHESFVYFSTDEVYGPAYEDGSHYAWSPHRPSNPYSASKAAGEDLCYPYWRSGDVKLIITNTVNNFGEMQRTTKFPAMLQSLIYQDKPVPIHRWGDEIGSRYYVHSRNVASALLHLLIYEGFDTDPSMPFCQPQKYQIGSGEDPIDNLAFAQLVAKMMNKPLQHFFVDCKVDNPAHDVHYRLDDTTAEVPDWIPPVSFEESLQQTIDWGLRHPAWLR